MIDPEDEFSWAIEAFCRFGDHTPYEDRFIVEVRSGFSPWNKGKTLPDHVKKKMSEARLANPTGTAGKRWKWSDEARKAFSERNRGRKPNK